MLTGDKLETATCIAKSSKLVSRTQDIYTLFVLLFLDLDVNWRPARDSHMYCQEFQACVRGARWLSGRVSDSGARGPGFETYHRRVVSLSKTLYSPKVLVNYPGSDGSVPT